MQYSVIKLKKIRLLCTHHTVYIRSMVGQSIDSKVNWTSAPAHRFTLLLCASVYTVWRLSHKLYKATDLATVNYISHGVIFLCCNYLHGLHSTSWYGWKTRMTPANFECSQQPVASDGQLCELIRGT